MLENSAFITIFTPTYNRFALLQRLYESINCISYENFEWLVVDDGSTDETESFFRTILNNTHFPITYIKQNNGGKHTAINRGAQEAKGELFFIVDSDDLLPSDSLEEINHYYSKIKNNSKIAGVVGRKKIINSEKSFDLKEKEFICSPFDFRYKFHYSGDMAEVIKTDILRQYPFPVFENEKFVTESLIWFRIGNTYDFLYFDKPVYLCEYQEGGLTDNYWKLIKNNPKGSLLYYRELLQKEISKEHKLNVLKTIKSIAASNGYSIWKLFNILGINNFLLLLKSRK